MFTVEDRQDVIALAVAVWGAAPGANNLSDLANHYLNGGNIYQLAENLVRTPTFVAQYPDFLTDQEFATKFIDIMVGAEIDANERLWAINNVMAQLNSGKSRAETIVDSLAILRAVDQETNPAWAAAARSFENKMEVAFYHSVEQQINETDVAALQAVLAGVDSSQASVDLAKSLIDSIANPSPVFTLKEVMTRHIVDSVTIDIDPVITNEIYWGYNRDGGGVPVEELYVAVSLYLSYQLESYENFDFARLLEQIDNITQSGVMDELQGAGGGQNDTTVTVTGDGSVSISQVSGGGEGDYTGDYQILIHMDDANSTEGQIALTIEQFNFINGLLFDQNGDTRLFEVEVKTWPQVAIRVDGTPYLDDVANADDGELLLDANGDPILMDLKQYTSPEGVSYTFEPIILTPSINNGGTMEMGRPNSFDNVIVAGRLDLLHQAFIDAGTGYDILEVDAKGAFAQPLQLLNIEEVRVQNLPNIYTYGEDGDNIDPFVHARTLGDFSNLAAAMDGISQNSVLDLSRAWHIEKLVVTEGLYDGLAQINGFLATPGSLTLTGIRNGAKTVLDGGFTQTVFLNYSDMQGTGVDLVFNNLSMGDAQGEDAANAQLVVAHNSNTLNIESTGGNNYLYNADLGGRLNVMNITGDAHLYIERDLDPSFHDGTPVTINASQNTGGVDLNLSGSQNVTFHGSQANDRFRVETSENNQFIGTNAGHSNDSSVTIHNMMGDNYLEVDAYTINVTLGDGHNNLEATGIVANIEAGHGNNHFELETISTHLHAGDGNNRIEIGVGNETSRDTTNPRYSVDYLNTANIVLGHGNNRIDAHLGEERGHTFTLATGDGDNAVRVKTDVVDISTGAGNDYVAAVGREVSVSTGAGDDVVKVAGSGSNYGFDDTVKLTVDMGAGNNALHLGDNLDYPGSSGNSFPFESGSGTNQTLTAMPGSSISGENITLYVNTMADLRAASIDGVTAIVLDDNDGLQYCYEEGLAVLTITDQQAAQFAADGVDISVDGGIFHTSAHIRIIVTENLDVTTGAWAAWLQSLPVNIDLQFVINDGATLKITAQQLHTKVAVEGITIADDNNTDQVSGKVHITNAGLDFDPFNNSDDVRSIIDGRPLQGGSLSTDPVLGFVREDADLSDGVQRSEWGFNVLLDRVMNGYNRPADAPSYSRLVIDTDAQGGEIGPFSTIETFLRLVGESGIEFTPMSGGIDEWGRPIEGGTAIQLGIDNGVPTNPYMVDFSSVGGVVNLTLGNFQHAAAIYGNDNNARLNVELGGNVGSATAGLLSRGVETYVVTAFTHDMSEFDALYNALMISVQTGIGRNVNYNALQAYVQGIDPSLMPTHFPLGDGDPIRDYVNEGNLESLRSDLLDSQSQFWTSRVTEDLEVLGLRGNYEHTIIFGNTQHGVDFLMEVAYDKFTGYSVGTLNGIFSRPGADAVVDVVGLQSLPSGQVQKVAGIILSNAQSATVNVTGGNTVIDVLSSDDLAAVYFNSENNISVTEALPLLSVVDATGVEGDFNVTIDTIAAAGLTFDASQAATNLTLAGPEYIDNGGSYYGGEDLGGFNNMGSVYAPLKAGVHTILRAEDSADFQLTILNAVDVSTATLVNVDNIVLGTLGSSGFIGGAELTLSFPQLTSIGQANITTVHPGVEGTVNLVGLGEDAFDASAMSADISIGSISIAGQPSVTLDADTVLSGVGELLVSAGTTLTLTAAQFQQLAGSGTIAGAGAVHITGLTQADVDAGLDLSGIEGPVTVTLAENVELAAGDDLGHAAVVIPEGLMLSLATHAQAHGLDVSGGEGSALKLLFSALDSHVADFVDASNYAIEYLRFNEWLISGDEGNNNVDALFQGLQQSVKKVIFSAYVELVDQTVYIDEGATVRSGLSFDRLEEGLELENFTLNLLGGSRVMGDINLAIADEKEIALLQTFLKSVTVNSTGDAANVLTGNTANIIDGAITTGTGSNQLLNVTINAEQNLYILGGIGFESLINDDATATLTITGDANVTLGVLDTSDSDVDALEVVHNGSGVLTFGLDGEDYDDALSVTGSGDVVINAAGTGDLSGATLDAVVQINVAAGAALTVTADQVEAMGSAGLQGAGTVNIIGLSDQAIDSTAMGANLTINVTTAAGAHTLDEDTDLSAVASFTIGAGSSVTMTAAQALQLDGATFGAGANSGLHITGVTQADLDAGLGNLLISWGGTVDIGSVQLTEDVLLKGSELNAATMPAGFQLLGEGVRVDIDMDVTTVGTNADIGIKSDGVSSYIVVDTTAPGETDYTVFVCNETLGLETLGLQENAGNTITFGGIKRGVNFLMEADGVANWDELEKELAITDVTSIGALVADFYTPNNPAAVVDINNRGVMLGAASDGGVRTMTVDGVVINNTRDVTINVADGSVSIGNFAGSQAETLTITNPDGDVATWIASEGELTQIDASGVSGTAVIGVGEFTGDFAATAFDAATVDLSGTTLIGVDAIALAGESELTLNGDQAEAFNGGLVAAGSDITLNIVDFDNLFDASLLPSDVSLGTVTTAVGNVVLDASVNLSGAVLNVPAGSSVTMTAAQFNQLDGEINAAGATVNITGLTQADIDAGFDLSDIEGQVNVTLAENVTLVGKGTELTADLSDLLVDLNGFFFTLDSAEQANGLNVTGGAGSELRFGFETVATTYVNADGTTITGIDASGYNVPVLKAVQDFFTPAAQNDIEVILGNLPDDTTLVIAAPDELGFVSQVARTVIVEEGAITPAGLIFNDIQNAREVAYLNIELQGSAVINGDIDLRTITPTDLIARNFHKLTLTSTGTAGGNRINGVISAGVEGAGSENNLLDVLINGDQNFTLDGIVFSYITDSKRDSNGVLLAETGAVLTVDNDANVTIGMLDVSDPHVDALTVNNDGAGTLNLTLTEATVTGTPEGLAFLGGNIALTIAEDEDVNLTAADLEGVASIAVQTDAELTLTQTQFNDLGASNLSFDGPAANSADLILTGFQGAVVFDATGVVSNLDIHLLMASGNQVMDPASNFTGVDSITVPVGGSLTMTAEQFLQLDSGTIVGAGGSSNYSLTITGLTQADVNAGFDLGNVTAGNIVLEADGNLIVPSENNVVLNNSGTFLGAAPGDVTVELDAGAILGLGDILQLSPRTTGATQSTAGTGLTVNGGAGSSVELQFFAGFGPFDTFDASGIDVGTLRMLNTLVDNRDIELLQNIGSNVVVSIYTAPEDMPGYFLNAINRQVVVEADTSVPGFLVFNDYQDDSELVTLDLTMQGGASIQGNLRLTTVEAGINPDTNEPYVPQFLQRVTIVSEGDSPNVIDGDIDPTPTTGANPIGTPIENNLLLVNIVAEQSLTVTGQIVFNAIGDNIIGTADDQTATLNVDVAAGASVVLNDLDTSDNDVVGLMINHTGDGALTFGLSSYTTIDPTDVLTVNGSATGMTTIVITGELDLSTDTLVNVDAIVLGAGTPPAGVTELILTQAQYEDIGAAGFSLASGTTAAELQLVDFDPTIQFNASDLASGITVTSITLQGNAGNVTLNPATDLSNVGELVIPAGTTLEMTADQFVEMAGNGTITGAGTVNITELANRHADIDFSDVAPSTAGTITLADNVGDVKTNIAPNTIFDPSLLPVGNLILAVFTVTGPGATGTWEDQADLGAFAIELDSNDHLTMTTLAQADGRSVVGPADSMLSLALDFADVVGNTITFTSSGPLAAIGDGIDTSQYGGNFTLEVLDALVEGQNLEQVLAFLSSNITVLIVEAAAMPGADLNVAFSTHRVVIVDEGVTVGQNVDGQSLIFADLNDNRLVKTLDLTLSGDATISGDIDISTLRSLDPQFVSEYFELLTINSIGDSINFIGDITAGVEGSPTENNLLDVIINAEQALGQSTLTSGTIFFSSRAPAATANLAVNGPAAVTLKALDTSDADVSGLVVVNMGGTLTLAGGSPGGNLVDTGSLTLEGDGDMVFGTGGNPGIDGGGTLGSIDASDLEGNLSISTLNNINGDSFVFTAGTGVTTLAVGDAELDDEGSWTFDLSSAPTGSVLELDGDADFSNGGDLTIDLGANAVLLITGDTDFTQLDNLSILQGQPIVVAEGAVLTLTADQANGLNIVGGTGGGTVDVVDLGTDPVDLSGIDPGIAGYVTLVGSPGPADVLLDINTDLGGFGVRLFGQGNDFSDGQNIRFANAEQAEREIDVVDNGSGTDGVNVVWFFNAITGDVAVPNQIDVSQYSGDIGRLWVTEALANGADFGAIMNMLPTTIIRVDFPAVMPEIITVPGLDAGIGADRVLEIVAFTQLPLGIQFADADRLFFVENLQIDMGGEVLLGELTLENILQPDVDGSTIQFDTLTLNSRLATGDPNDPMTPDEWDPLVNLAPTGANVVGDIQSGAGLTLENVIINAVDVDIEIGTIYFDSEITNPGTLTVTGDFDVTIKSVNSIDMDINSVVIDDINHNGVLLITGGSAAAAVQNTESLLIDAGPESSVLLGHVFDGSDYVLNTDSNDDPYAGVAGADLSLIDVTGGQWQALLTTFHAASDANLLAPGPGTGLALRNAYNDLIAEGLDLPAIPTALSLPNQTLFVQDQVSSIPTVASAVVNLGVIAQVDSEDFTLNGDGITTAIMGAAVVNPLVAPELSATGTWTFNDATVTITEDVILNAGGSLVLDGVNLIIEGDVDLSELNLDFSNVNVQVTEGSVVTLDVGQLFGLSGVYAGLTGDLIWGSGTTKLVGDATGVTATGAGSLGIAIQSIGVDLSEVTTSDAVLPYYANGALFGAGALNDEGDLVGFNILGSANDDDLRGSDLDDVIDGLGGDDTIIGGFGDDVLIGSDGDNLLIDSLGDNTFIALGGSSVATGLLAGTGVSTGDILQIHEDGEMQAFVSPGNFVATDETFNDGIATIEAGATVGGITIDLSLAGGDSGWTIIGSGVVGASNILIGSDNADVINGGNDVFTGGRDFLTGNGGNDVFVFNTTISEPAELEIVGNLRDAIDNEWITVVAGDNTTNRTGVTIEYTRNQTTNIILVSLAGVDLEDADELGAAITAGLNNQVSGIAATWNSADSRVEVTGLNGNAIEFGAITPAGGTTTGPMAFTPDAASDATDRTQVTELTVSGTVLEGETYNLTVLLRNGQEIVADEYVAQLGDEAGDVRDALIASFNAVSAIIGSPVTAYFPDDPLLDDGFDDFVGPADNTTIVLRGVTDNGGFTVTNFSAAGSFEGSGASAILDGTEANDLYSADIITDFNQNGNDVISLGLAAGQGGVSGNYDFDGLQADYEAAYLAAESAMSGNVIYFFTTIEADLAYATATDGVAQNDTLGLLFFDANSNGTPDGLIVLLGVDENNFSHVDMVA